MTKRAIIQVENTDKIINLAKYLESSGWTIVSSGKNGDLLKKEKISYVDEPVLEDASISKKDASEIIQRVLETSHELDNEEYNENNYHLLCINMYPYPMVKNLRNMSVRTPNFFLSTILRNAFINYQNIMILTDPDDYEEAVIQLRTDSVSKDFCLYLAGKAMNMISAFDSSLACSILLNSSYGSPFMNYLMIPLKKQQNLHFASNSQQQASLYNYSTETGALSGLKKLQGKELTYNIICDLSVAWDNICGIYTYLKNQFSVKSINSEGYEFTSQFTPLTGTVFTVAVKFKGIVGAALSTNVLDSFKKTHTYDFDNIDDVVLGCSAVIDKKAAEEIVSYKCVAVIAPGFTDDAKEILAENKNIRLIPTAKVSLADYCMNFLNGGVLLESRDNTLFNKWHVKTRMRPSQKQTDEMALGMLLALNAHSYSAILLRANSIVGIAQACSSRRSAIRDVLIEAEEYVERNQCKGETLGDILVCDTSIPFCNEVRKLIEKGVTAIIQTGGTSDDEEFIKFCDERGVVMVFTNMAHISF